MPLKARKTGNLPKLAHLLSEPISQDEAFFWNDQRIVNINTALDIVSLTVEPGNIVTKYQMFGIQSVIG
ncbi:ANL_HP_G0188560.mRNA.1.CDS.1 [Saccharomyces cerevisiae]|nr:ANL_HP_G0188560.mRNA.1.CDS.1 [Saccharomyces cerevisiae]CAI6400245.1 ANL_HP_G0188560.mRNA.1.CDS.1 [Saccharomyces cerevisiae]